MSYGSDYKDRHRRNRRRDTKLLFYVLKTALTTAALVAIAFAFDVPEKLRAKFWGVPPDVARQEPIKHLNPPSPSPREEPPVNEPPAPEEFDDPPRRPFDPPRQPEASRARQPKVVIPKRETPPDTPRPDAAKIEVEPDVEPPGEVLVLDLSRRTMRIAIADRPALGKRAARVRVLGLGNSAAACKLKPASGDVREQLEVLFPEHPRARLLIRTDLAGNRMFLIVEPQVDLGYPRPVPMTADRMERALVDARGELEQLTADVADEKENVARLKAWVKPGTGPKALAEVNRAKAYIAEVEPQLPQRDAEVERSKQWVRELEMIHNLTEQLDKKAELQFEFAEAD